MRVRTVLDAAISPDGELVGYVLDAVDSAHDRHVQDLWVVATHGVNTPRLARRDVHGTPRWAPDGRRLAVLSGQRGHRQVWAIDPGSGAAHQLTRVAGGVTDFQWSPDGRVLGLLVEDPADTSPPGRPAQTATSPDTHLYLADLRTGHVRRLTSGHLTVGDLSWSPTGTEIVFEAHPRATVADEILGSDLDVVNTYTGEVRALVHRPGEDVAPRWSPDGKWIGFVSHDGHAEWIGDAFICVVPATGGPPRNLSPGLGERLLPGEFTLAWRPDARALFVTVPRRDGAQVVQADLEGTMTDVTTGTAPHAAPTFSRDGQTMAFVSSMPDTPWEVFVSGPRDAEPRRLTWSNPDLASASFGEMRAVEWRSDGRTLVSGLVVLPVGYAPGHAYPLLTYLHGGPAWNFVRALAPHGALPTPVQSEIYPVQVLAGRGYAIFLPNPRGSLGFGHDFRLAAVRDLGGGDFRDVMAGIDTLVALGIADSSRLGLMGFSYGGALAAWTLTRTTRFKAAAIGAGFVDPATMYAGTDIPELMTAYFGEPPWDNDSLYWTRSTLLHAAQIHTPALIQHGTADHRVPVDQSRALDRALRELRIPAELDEFDGQGHGLTRPSMQRKAMQQVIAWFDRWLPPAARAADR